MSNWNALGSIAEFVAAIGVIASLVYLAVQIRQNTQSIRASTYEGMVRGSGDFLLPLIQDRDLAKSFERAVDRWSQLDYEEQVQVMYLLTQLFRNWENAYYQHRQGTLEPWLWEAWQHVVLSYFHQPGVQDWWKFAPGRLFEAIQRVSRVVLTTWHAARHDRRHNCSRRPVNCQGSRPPRRLPRMTIGTVTPITSPPSEARVAESAKALMIRSI
jgi:hypothetical protein